MVFRTSPRRLLSPICCPCPCISHNRSGSSASVRVNRICDGRRCCDDEDNIGPFCNCKGRYDGAQSHLFDFVVSGCSFSIIGSHSNFNHCGVPATSPSCFAPFTSAGGAASAAANCVLRSSSNSCSFGFCSRPKFNLTPSFARGCFNHNNFVLQ